MKRTVFYTIVLCLLILLLAGCAESPAAEGTPTQKPWPTHAPGATPYIRAMNEVEPPAEEAEGETFQSMEELWNSIYERFGRFYAKKDELEMFRALPQDSVYSFVPHSPRFVLDEGEAMRMAKLFDALDGVDARVIAMHQIVDGRDDWGFLTVLTMTPARLFELSEELDEMYMFEQFYPQVQERFDIDYWPDGLYEEAEAALRGYEIRGCFYFRPELMKQLEEIDGDEIGSFALREYTPGGWSEDGQQLLWSLRGRELDGLALYWREGSSESLCVASMTMRQLSALSNELPGRYLLALADETLTGDYDGVIRLTPDLEEVA